MWDGEKAEQVVDKLFKYNGARIKLYKVRKDLTIMLHAGWEMRQTTVSDMYKENGTR